MWYASSSDLIEYGEESPHDYALWTTGADPGDAAGDWSIRRPRRSRRLRFSLDARYATAGWPLAGCLRPSHLRGPGRQRVYAWGPGVTNPLTRHPVATASAIISLDEASEGRADLVAGSGYSSAYIIGRKAATLSTMRQATQLWRSIFQVSRPNWVAWKSAFCRRVTLPIYLANRAQDAPAGRRNCRWGADHGGRCPRHSGLGVGTNRPGHATGWPPTT